MAADWARNLCGPHIHKTRTMYFEWWMKSQRIVIWWRYGGDWKVSHGPEYIQNFWQKLGKLGKFGKYGELVETTAAKARRKRVNFPIQRLLNFSFRVLPKLMPYMLLYATLHMCWQRWVFENTTVDVPKYVKCLKHCVFCIRLAKATRTSYKIKRKWLFCNFCNIIILSVILSVISRDPRHCFHNFHILLAFSTIFGRTVYAEQA